MKTQQYKLSEMKHRGKQTTWKVREHPWVMGNFIRAIVHEIGVLGKGGTDRRRKKYLEK